MIPARKVAGRSRTLAEHLQHLTSEPPADHPGPYLSPKDSLLLLTFHILIFNLIYILIGIPLCVFLWRHRRAVPKRYTNKSRTLRSLNSYSFVRRGKAIPKGETKVRLIFVYSFFTVSLELYILYQFHLSHLNYNYFITFHLFLKYYSRSSGLNRYNRVKTNKETDVEGIVHNGESSLEIYSAFISSGQVAETPSLSSFGQKMTWRPILVYVCRGTLKRGRRSNKTVSTETGRAGVFFDRSGGH